LNLQVAIHLRNAGVRKGTRVALLFDISESAITHILAIMSLGAVAVLANRQIPPHILSKMFKRYAFIPFPLPVAQGILLLSYPLPSASLGTKESEVVLRSVILG
jgi:hypothetical protein